MDRQAIEELTMPITYGRHLQRLFDPEALLKGTGIPTQELQKPDQKITVKQALRYVSNAIKIAPEPSWYLEWAHSIADHFHGPISIALLSTPTLGAGLDTFSRFFPSRIPYMHIDSHVADRFFHLEFLPLIDLLESKPLLIETPMVILRQHIETVYGVDLEESRTQFDYSASLPTDAYEKHFGAQIRFQASTNAIIIPTAWREIPNLSYNEISWAHAIGLCEIALPTSKERNILGKIKRHQDLFFMKVEKQRTSPTMREISDALHISPRTLIRWLGDLGTSYQEVTDDYLKMRALGLLRNQNLAINTIAAKLGFSDPTNFGKRFKRWYGCSPGIYRRQL